MFYIYFYLFENIEIMKKLNLLIIVLLIVNFLNAQSNPKAILSPELSLKGFGVIEDLLLYNSEGLFVTVNRRRSFRSNASEIHKFDLNFNFVKEIDLFSDSLYYFPVKILTIGNDISCIGIKEDPENDLLHYYLHTIDNNLEIKERKKINSFYFDRMRGRPNLITEYSQDSSKVAMLFYFDENKKNEKVEMFMVVFDSDSNILWTKEIKDSEPQLLVDIKSMQITNEGDLYLLTKVFDNYKKLESKKINGQDLPAYDFNILKLNNSSLEKSIFIETDDLFITSTNFVFTSNNYLNFTGIFSTTRKKLINGILTLNINQKNDSIVKRQLSTFRPEDIIKLENADALEEHSDDKGLQESFKFLKAVYRKDNTSTIVLEKSANFTRFDSDTYMNYNARNKSYEIKKRNKGINSFSIKGMIVTINLDSNNQINNITLLPKSQRFMNDDSLLTSCIVLLTENGLNLIYNENEKNFDIEIGEKIKTLTKVEDCVATNIYIDRNGKILSKTRLFDAKDSKAVIIPRFAKKILLNKIFVSCSRMPSFESLFQIKESEKRIAIIEY